MQNPLAFQSIATIRKSFASHKKGLPMLSGEPIGVTVTGGTVATAYDPVPHEKFGDKRFKQLLRDEWALHCKKAADYGSDSDPLANLRRCERLGIPAITGTLVRLEDKFHRLERWHEKGALANESVEDTLQDISCYCKLALMLLREQAKKEGPDAKQQQSER
jgi:hypothetical protein